VPVPAGATTGPVTVTVGGTASNGLNFSIGTGVVTGTITSAADATAVSGARIEALQSNIVRASASSVSDGTYSINGLAPGTYDVRTSAAGFGSLVSTGRVVTVGTPTTVNAALPSPGSDSGTVTSSNGSAAISGAQVAALQNNVVVSTATADSSGNFNIANLGPGSYVMQASAQGYTTQTVTNVAITSAATQLPTSPCKGSQSLISIR